MIRAIIFGAGVTLFLATLPTLAQTTRLEPTATSKRPIKLEAPSGSPAVPLGQPSTPSAFREMRAGDLIGESVYNTGGESMGQIEDIVVNRGNNAIAALVGMGGFLGVGEKQVAVLLSDLEMQGDSIVVKDLTRTDFQWRLAYQANDWVTYDRSRLIDGATLR